MWICQAVVLTRLNPRGKLIAIWEEKEEIKIMLKRMINGSSEEDGGHLS